MNLDAVLRIAAKVTGTEAVQQLNRAVGAAGRTAEGAKKSFKNVVDSAAWQGAAVVATGIGVALGVAARQAIQFESAVADVRKVVSGIDTPRGLTEIRQEILQLSREMPITAQGFAQIYAAAGQSGIARDQIRAFAIDVTKMAVAFDMTAEDAGNAMAKLRTSLGLSQPQVLSLADALNHLSNNTASTGAELVNFTKRSGAMGKQAGLSAEQTAAFGAAMIGAGVEVEVAATSFNNMIRALARGSSMTARQESALKRLGLASRTVADGERELTAAVQRGSDRRLEIIQDESDRQQAELRKRYRRQLQLLEDQWEDESDGYADAVRDQSDAQIKALQRQAEQRIRALQRQAGDNQDWADQQADTIRDNLEREIDLIRDATDRRLRLQQRADRDRRQEVRDSMDEQMADELKGLERIARQREEAEKESTKRAIEAAKAAAGAGGSEAGRALAKRLQDDALGTIRDVFQRIQGLAADERISVISDLFGDEARGLTPLISNLGSLEQALGMVADKTRYAGSMTREYEVRSQTAANALQLAQNNFNALAIEIGAQVVPALVKFVQFLNPVIIGLSKFASANPQITAVAVAVAALGSAFVVAAPFILATVKVLATIGTVLKGITLAAPAVAATSTAIVQFGTATAAAGGFMYKLGFAVGVAARGILFVGFTIGKVVAAIGAAMAAVGAAPIVVGLAIGAVVAAVIAGVVVWRREIGGFFSWLIASAVAGWNALIAPLRSVLDTFVVEWNRTMERVGAIYSALARMFYQLFIEPVVAMARAYTGVLVSFWSAAFNAISGVVTQWVAGLQLAFSTVADLYFRIVIKPITDRAQALWGFLARGWNAFSTVTSGVFRSIANAYQNIVVRPLVSAWTRIVDTGKAAIRGLLGWAAGAINGVIGMVNRLISGVNRARQAVGLSTISQIPLVTVPRFARGAFVNGETLAVMGDNRSGREYAVPEEKVVGFANNIIAGRRGAAAIPTGTSTGSGGGSVSINITTGPVRQDASGQRWMTLEDGERMAREVAAQVLRTQRTPGGRYASGVR